MTRADLLAFVGEQYRALLHAADITPSDDGFGLTLALDRALRRTGSPTEGPVVAGMEEAAEALAEYHTLQRIRASLAASTEIEAQNARSGKSQLFNQVTALLTDAAARLAALGFAPGSVTDGGAAAAPAHAFRIGLDFIEPEWRL